MICPFCLHGKTQVNNSRKTKKYNAIWRRRKCIACKKEFTTYETADPSQYITLVQGKRLIPFSRSKLTLSLAKTFSHRLNEPEMIMHLQAAIEARLIIIAARRQHLTKEEIIATTLQVLKNSDTAAFLKYLSNYAPNLSEQAVKSLLKRDATFSP